MWSLEFLKAINNPKKHAKTAKQKKAVKDFREKTGFTIDVNKNK